MCFLLSPTGFHLVILWTYEANSILHEDLNTHKCRIWATSNPREHTDNLLHYPKVTASCEFTSSFMIRPFFFESYCPKNGQKATTEKAKCTLALLHEKVVPRLREKGAFLLPVTFLKDEANSHISAQVKEFLKQTLGKEYTIKVVACSHGHLRSDTNRIQICE